MNFPIRCKGAVFTFLITAFWGLVSCTPSPQTSTSPPDATTTTPQISATITTPLSATLATSPTPTPTTDTIEAIEDIISILSHTTYTDDFGYFHIIGEAVNDGKTSITDCKIQVEYYDEEGNITASGSGEPFRNLLRPGEKSPFEIVLLKTPQTSTYKLTVSSHVTSQLLKDTVSVINYDLESVDNVEYKVTGQVQNNSDTVISAAIIIGSFYNRNGDITAIGYTFPDTQPLPPGAISNFVLTVGYHNMPVMSFTLYTEIGP